jgi:hypothetical protein
VVGVDVGGPPSVDVIPGLEVVPIHAIRQHPYHPSTSDDDKNTGNGSPPAPPQIWIQSDWSLFLITRNLVHDYGGREDWNQSMKHQIRGRGRRRRLPWLAARGGVLSGEGIIPSGLASQLRCVGAEDREEKDWRQASITFFFLFPFFIQTPVPNQVVLRLSAVVL